MITEQEITKLRSRHSRCEVDECDECQVDWPCDAWRLLDEIDRLRTSDKTLREQVRQLEQSCDTLRERIDQLRNVLMSYADEYEGSEDARLALGLPTDEQEYRQLMSKQSLASA